MTGDPYQSVIPGTSRQAPSARTFNGLLKAGQAYSRSKFGDLETGAGGAAVDPQTECLIQNNTGVDLVAFSVLVQGAAFVDPATDPYDVQAQKVFQAAAVADVTLPFVITEGPVLVDGFIEAVVSGLAVVAVNVTDITHRRAVPVVGVTDHLVSAASGGVVLWWAPAGTGLKTCLVMVGSQGDGPDATPTQRGWVNTGSQAFGGFKTFQNGAQFGNSAIGSPAALVDFASAGDLGVGPLFSWALGVLSLTRASFAADGFTAQQVVGPPLPGITVNVTIGGTTLHFTGGLLTSVS